MSVATIGTWQPFVDLVPYRGFTPNALANFKDRIISFNLEEDAKKPLDEVTLVLDNGDGQLFTKDSLAMGVVFKVIFGYFGNTAPPRLMQCTKMSVAARVGGLGKISGPNTVAGGNVTLTLNSMVWDMNLYRFQATHSVVQRSNDPLTQGEKRKSSYPNATIPEIVRELFYAQGFEGATALIEELENEPRHERYVIPSDLSTAEWIANRAKERGWTFGIDADGAHFHGPKFDPPGINPVTLRWFAGDPDIISWNISGDMKVPQNVGVKGVDTKNEYIIGSARVGEAGERTNFTANLGQGFGLRYVTKNGEEHAEIYKKKGTGKRLTPDLMINTSNPSKKQAEQAEKVMAKGAGKWRLTLELVGNPFVKSRSKIYLDNFGPQIDGQWYITKCTHSIQAGQVYKTTVELKRSGPKKKDKPKYIIGAIRLGEAGERSNFTVVNVPPAVAARAAQFQGVTVIDK